MAQRMGTIEQSTTPYMRGNMTRACSLMYQNLDSRNGMVQQNGSSNYAGSVLVLGKTEPASPGTLSRTASETSLQMFVCGSSEEDCESGELCSSELTGSASQSFDARSSSLSSNNSSCSELSRCASFSQLRSKYSAELAIAELSPKQHKQPILPKRCHSTAPGKKQLPAPRHPNMSSAARFSRANGAMLKPRMMVERYQVSKQASHRERENSTPSCLTPTSPPQDCGLMQGSQKELLLRSSGSLLS